MYSLLAKSSISMQDCFQKENILELIEPIGFESELVQPNYKEFLPPAFLRRLSPIIKMGLTTATDCLSQVNNLPFDAIIVGTGLGCLKDTEKFLINILSNAQGVISPTAFILSTHNTIGGQISLSMKNHSYNMTHTQNNISFETSLIDAMMQINEGKKNVLVGGCDEYIPFLDNLNPNLIPKKYPYTSLASFFVVGTEHQEKGANIVDVKVAFNVKNVKNKIKSFLEKNSVDITEIDMVFHSDLNAIFLDDFKEKLNYHEYAGFNYSASAFAMHMAADYVQNNSKSKALVVNYFCGQLGLILLT